jgi:N-acetylneuraminic acid mutarotase
VTSASAAGGDGQATLTWTNSTDTDLGTIVVLQGTSTVNTHPVEGTTYSVGNTVGTSTVACVVTGSPPTTSCTATGLNNGTAYSFRIFAEDTRGNYSATGTIPTGSPVTPTATPPRRPILNSPAPNATSSASSGAFTMTGTSPGSHNLEYKQVIYQNEACTQVVQTNDQTASQTGWTGQNASSSHEYSTTNATGTSGTYTLQSNLTASTTYYWGAQAIDPEGSGSFGTSTLTTVTPNWGNTTALPSAINQLSAVVYNGYVYMIGGNTSSSDAATTATSTVFYAPINSNGTVGAWTKNSNSLPSAIFTHSAVAYNGYIYTKGGEDSSGNPTSTVFYAPINSNGTVGAWTKNSNSLPSANEDLSSVAYNGYLYTTGGYGLGGATSSIFYAPINSTGSVGVWSTTTKIPSVLSHTSAVVANGYIYMVGGTISSPTSTVFYAPINSTGSIGTWSTTTATPDASTQHAAVVANGYIYRVGFGNVVYAPINSNGTVGTWTTTNNLPSTLQDNAAVVSNGYLYTMGGTSANAATSTVFYANINEKGRIADEGWNNDNPLPSAIAYHSAVASNGYLYSTGGQNNGLATSSVFYAPINSNGTLGTWQKNSNSLPDTLYWHSAVAYNGYLYTTGGHDSSTNNATSSVFYAPINSNGTVGTWQKNSNSLPSALREHSAVAYNGYMYTMGGYSTGNTSTVFYAPINSNGTVGTWQTTTALPSTLIDHSAVAANGYLYVAGGSNGGAVSTVYYAPVNPSGTIGVWSQTSALPVALSSHSAGVYNGYLYVAGGSSGSVTSTVYYAPIPPPAVGSGTIGSWLAAKALPTALDLQSSVLANGYFFITGGTTNGINSGVTSTVQSAPLYTSCTPFTAVSSGGGGGGATSTLTQEHYQWYANAPSLVNPTSSLASLDAAASDVASGTIVRLLFNIGATNAALATSTLSLKLQFSTATSSGWADIGASSSASIWRSGDNPNLTDPTNVTSTLLASSTAPETYEETNPSASNTTAIANGGWGEWDWAVQQNGAVPNTRYYFRLIQSSGTVLDAYTRYPALSTQPGAPGTPTYANISASTLTVNWTAPSPDGGVYSLSYKVERATSSQVYAQIFQPGCCTVNDSGLATSTTYFYRVRATTLGGDGPYSASSSATTTAPSGSTTLTEEHYQWYANGDIVNPTSTLAALDSIATVISSGTVLRLRVNVGASGSAYATTTSAFKLQFSTSTTGGWADVGATSSAVAWVGEDNPITANGANVTSTLLASSTVGESYVEYNNSPSNPSAIASGGWGEWDWVVQDNGAAASTTYYFQMVKSDGTPLDSYTRYPSASTGLPPTGSISSIIFDTTATSSGPAYNSILWKGSVNGGTGKVRFQFASSDCPNAQTNPPTCSTAGSWNFIGGPTCSSVDWYSTTGPNAPVELTCSPLNHNNQRWFRYKVQLCSNSDCTTSGAVSPLVTSVVVNWSP